MTAQMMALAAVVLIMATPARAMTADDVVLAIRAQCEANWKNNYIAVRECIKAEGRGLLRAQEYSAVGGETKKILQRCFREWYANSESPSWLVVAECTKYQLKAYNDLQKQTK